MCSDGVGVVWIYESAFYGVQNISVILMHILSFHLSPSYHPHPPILFPSLTS